MNRKMIFFDIDGTLARDGSGKVPGSTREALVRARENGHLLFINTGRTYCAINDSIRSLPFHGYITGCGTYIYYQGKTLLANPLAPDLCRKIVEKMRSLCIPTFYEGNDHLYFDPENPIPQYKYDQLNQSFSPDVFLKIRPGLPLSFEKLLIFSHDGSDLEGFERFIQGRFLHIHRERGMGEIVQAAYSKATGIQFFINKLGIPLKDCFAIGDGTNDLPMLTFVPHSIAMGNSMEEILPYCSYQTTGIEEDGIYLALEHFGII